MINLKDVVRGLEEIKSTVDFGYFKSDREPIEFNKSDYDLVLLVDVDNTSFRKSETNIELNGERYNREVTDRVIETAVGIVDNGTELIFSLLIGTTNLYGGKKEVSYVSQELTLAGLNKFTRDVECDLTEWYDLYLKYEGYEITVNDILELGEFNPEFNVTILNWLDESGNKYWLTVNSRKQLTKITVKASGRKVVPKAEGVSSAFE